MDSETLASKEEVMRPSARVPGRAMSVYILFHKYLVCGLGFIFSK